MVKNLESLGAPGQRHDVNGCAYWHGSGRLTVCDSSNINHQTSRILSRLPEDIDVQDVIHAMAQEIRETFERQEQRADSRERQNEPICADRPKTCI